MKRIILATAIMTMLFSGIAYAQVHVNGYYRQNGTYVQPHQRTAPDYTPNNNYSTYPNVNPYTGQQGYKQPYNSYGGNNQYNGQYNNGNGY